MSPVYYEVNWPCLVIFQNGGDGEIRTLGAVTPNGFQDRHHKPLGHVSKNGAN
jgi:hypothetical protein